MTESNLRSGVLKETLAAIVVENQRAGVVVQTADGTVVDFNPAALKVLAMTAEQLTGKSSLDPSWQAVDLDLRPVPGERHPAMRCLATGEPVHQFPMGVRTGDQIYRWLLIDSWPVDIDGERGALTQFADVTEQITAQRRTTETIKRLQRHALPTPHDGMDWLTVVTRYHGVTPPLDIGGDFFDLFPLSDQRRGFFLGDACGHNLETISTMMMARHALRVAGLHLDDAGQVLSWLHETLKAVPNATFCTAVFGWVAPYTDGVTVRLANAGHPPPIVIGPDRSELVIAHGAVVGVLPDYETPTEVEIRLEPGQHLIVYSDGLQDSMFPRLTVDMLVDRLADTDGTLDAIISEVDRLIGEAETGGRPRQDDTAVMILSCPMAGGARNEMSDTRGAPTRVSRSATSYP